MACLSFYLISPTLLLSHAYAANTHYCITLSDIQTRTGKEVEIDRAQYTATNNTIECYIDKHITIAPRPINESGTISIRGYFLDKSTIKLTDYHVHRIFRDYASYTGLFLTLLLWTHSLLDPKRINNMHRNCQ